MECEIQSFKNGTLSDRVKLISENGNLAKEFQPNLVNDDNFLAKNLPIKVSDIKIATVPIPGFMMRESRDGKFAIECKVKILDRNVDN